MPSNEGRFSEWLKNGRLATLVWSVVFVVWITFKVLKIDVGQLDTVFVTITGSWVANLTLMAAKKEQQPQVVRLVEKEYVVEKVVESEQDG